MCPRMCFITPPKKTKNRFTPDPLSCLGPLRSPSPLVLYGPEVASPIPRPRLAWCMPIRPLDAHKMEDPINVSASRCLCVQPLTCIIYLFESRLNGHRIASNRLVFLSGICQTTPATRICYRSTTNTTRLGWLGSVVARASDR